MQPNTNYIVDDRIKSRVTSSKIKRNIIILPPINNTNTNTKQIDTTKEARLPHFH